MTGFFAGISCVKMGMGMARENQGAKNGYLILEVLAALGLVALAVHGLFLVFGSTMGWIRDAACRTQAVYYASSLLEELMAHPERLTTGEFAPPELDLSPPPSGFEAAVMVAWNQQETRTYRVKVEVTWDIKGRPRRQILAAVVRGG